MADKLLTGDIKVDNVLTMGIFQYYKWDAIRRQEAARGRQLSDSEYKNISDDFSELNWRDFLNKSDQTLTQYRTTDQKWLIPIVQGLISAFLYSIFLVVVLVIIRLNDIDILHALKIDVNQTNEHSPPSPATAPVPPQPQAHEPK